MPDADLHIRLQGLRGLWRRARRTARRRAASAPLPGARAALFGTALALLAGFTILNQVFLSHLREHADAINDKEARLYAVAISEQLTREEINVTFNEIVRESDVPMIITNPEGTPINWNNIRKGLLGRGRELGDVPFSTLSWEDQQLLVQWLQRMDAENHPLELDVDGQRFGALHYGDPPVVRVLWWTPLAELVITLLFCFIGYFGFHIIRSNEQTLLWVGLAKETAHQLGTPISSLLGWIDILRMRLSELPDSEKTVRLLGEMESDIARLNRVATRFSKIGSLPELKPEDLNEIIRLTIHYFQSRLPHLGKRIRIEERLEDLPPVFLSAELIGWVLENLLRNAVDSIEAQAGLIIISTQFVGEEGAVHLDVEDNGKGIPREHFKTVFSTGFTTKKRGWGLGLALCRRIVEDYHEGRIFVESSVKDEGTVFKIVLPVHAERGARR